MQSGCSLDVRLSNITILYGYGDPRLHAASDVQISGVMIKMFLFSFLKDE